jgi:hypothetical protein
VDKTPKDLHPVVKEFKELIEDDTRVFLLFSAMFDQVPNKRPYNNDPTGHRQIRDYEHMLIVLNHLLTTAPSWNDKTERVGLIGVPINAILDWPMGTAGGFAVFLDPKVNAMLKKLLNAWGKYLCSPESANVLGNHPEGQQLPMLELHLMRFMTCLFVTQLPKTMVSSLGMIFSLEFFERTCAPLQSQTIQTLSATHVSRCRTS